MTTQSRKSQLVLESKSIKFKGSKRKTLLESPPRPLAAFVFFILTCPVWLVVTCAQVAASPYYTIVDLGPFNSGLPSSSGRATSKITSPIVPGTQMILGGEKCIVSALNGSQQIVGTATSRSGTSHAFLWSNGVLTDLGTLGGDLSFGYSLNSKGQVCGCAYAVPSHALRHAFVWQQDAAGAGTMKDLGTLGGPNSTALAINDAGQVAGFAYTATGDYHAFLWQAGLMKDLGTLGGRYSIARSLNAGGQIAGNSLTASGEQHACLINNAQIKDLYPLSSPYSDALCINRVGQIVGMAELPTGAYRAFIYQAGRVSDLNTCIPSGTNWVLQEARIITDTGQVAGLGTLKGQVHAFLLTPPAVDVTASLTVLRGGFRYNAGTRQYVQQVLLKNRGTQPIDGPFSLVLAKLSTNANLLNPSGVTTNALAAGCPFVTASQGVVALAPGQSVTVTLQFHNPTNRPITYTAYVLAGPGTR